MLQRWVLIIVMFLLFAAFSAQNVASKDENTTILSSLQQTLILPWWPSDVEEWFLDYPWGYSTWWGILQGSTLPAAYGGFFFAYVGEAKPIQVNVTKLTIYLLELEPGTEVALALNISFQVSTAVYFAAVYTYPFPYVLMIYADYACDGIIDALISETFPEYIKLVRKDAEKLVKDWVEKYGVNMDWERGFAVEEYKVDKSLSESREVPFPIPTGYPWAVRGLGEFYIYKFDIIKKPNETIPDVDILAIKAYIRGWILVPVPPRSFPGVDVPVCFGMIGYYANWLSVVTSWSLLYSWLADEWFYSSELLTDWDWELAQLTALLTTAYVFAYHALGGIAAYWYADWRDVRWYALWEGNVEVVRLYPGWGWLPVLEGLPSVDPETGALVVPPHLAAAVLSSEYWSRVYGGLSRLESLVRSVKRGVEAVSETLDAVYGEVRVLRGVVEPGLSRLEGLVRSVNESLSKAIESMAARVERSIAAAAEHLAESLEGLGARLESSIRGVNESLSRGLAGLEERLSERLRSIADEVAGVTEGLEELRKLLYAAHESLARRLHELNQTLTAELHGATHELGEKLARVNETLATLVEETRESLERSLGETEKSLGERLERLHESLTERLTEETQRLHKAQTRATQELRELREMVKQLQLTLYATTALAATATTAAIIAATRRK